ncbi:MAG: hypothetical protein RLY93_11995 [Sumerlaeia bacterium]
MIGFEDFVPAQLDKPGFLKRAQYEPLSEVMKRLNAWVEQHQVEVLQFETVVIPNMHSRWEEGSRDPETGTGGEVGSVWNQFIRVWYRY